MKYLLLILLTLSTAAQAELEEWYKKAIKVPNPNELPLLTATSGCESSIKEDFRSVVEGVLVRSRIKPLQIAEHFTKPEKYPINLNAAVSCVADLELYTFLIAVSFGRINLEEGVNFIVPYGSIGRNETAVIKNEVKKSIERAITDYVKVNFDL